MPPLRWPAVIAGLAVAVIAALASAALLPPALGSLATIIGIGLGGYLAGKWAGFGGLWHGALVGAGWVVIAEIGLIPSSSVTRDVLKDTAVVIALDAVMIGAAALGGWLSRTDRASSSGTGRAR